MEASWEEVSATRAGAPGREQEGLLAMTGATALLPGLLLPCSDLQNLFPD